MTAQSLAAQIAQLVKSSDSILNIEETVCGLLSQFEKEIRGEYSTESNQVWPRYFSEYPESRRAIWVFQSETDEGTFCADNGFKEASAFSLRECLARLTELTPEQANAILNPLSRNQRED